MIKGFKKRQLLERVIFNQVQTSLLQRFSHLNVRRLVAIKSFLGIAKMSRPLLKVIHNIRWVDFQVSIWNWNWNRKGV